MMIRIVLVALSMSLCLYAAGCSEQTQQDAGEALEATGDAMESAAKDAAENTRQAAEDVEQELDKNEPNENSAPAGNTE